MVVGKPEWTAGSGNFPRIEWKHEGNIHSHRSSSETTTATPAFLSIRRNPDNERRWELLAYPQPGEDENVQFSYELYFTKMTNPTAFTPIPFRHDSTMIAAVRATVETELDDTPEGPNNAKYQRELAKSHIIDGRSNIKTLGKAIRTTGQGPLDLNDISDEFRRLNPGTIDISSF